MKSPMATTSTYYCETKVPTPRAIREIDMSTDPHSIMGLLPKYDNKMMPTKEHTKLTIPISPVTTLAVRNPPK